TGCPLARTDAKYRARCRFRSLLTGTFRLSTINSQLPTTLESLSGGALAQKFSDIKIHKVGVMENDGFDRALYLVAFMTMRGNDMHHFAGNPVLVGERDAAEGMPHLLPKL